MYVKYWFSFQISQSILLSGLLSTESFSASLGVFVGSCSKGTFFTSVTLGLDLFSHFVGLQLVGTSGVVSTGGFVDLDFFLLVGRESLSECVGSVSKHIDFRCVVED
ncbi:uncharacterized protein BYT42DRAFT_589730 [Radiomyces spectabilis]|uniref:uncharacterized protein n=1 Tax=Radiomyces spectabilis TaxID=64574 RepID=UPI0022205950|nr:uncharacterized protein BYT42DRAFT_589730 [Radiomyces spectabilis]KAI8365388.1 hypothetical protein BYT42DRAFT_589730 [Radiomyces spectabilis]